jgi:methylated-DNA-protein-cysteine methyltransferase-like protein
VAAPASNLKPLGDGRIEHRAVARLLRTVPSGTLPWQRVIGARGAIKVPADGGAEQRLRLELEGVKFRGDKVDLAAHQHEFGPWD